MLSYIIACIIEVTRRECMMASLQFVFFNILILAYNNANGQGRGALRLVRNNHYSTIQAYTSGIVDIYYAGGWGNICDDLFAGPTEANVICNQLGFDGVISYGSAGSILIYGTDTSPMKIEGVSCLSSSYLSLLSQCIFSSAYSSFCLSNHYNDLYVSCYTSKIWNNPYNGQIRLIGGTYSNQGRLEVYCNGQWGTVCDDTFGSTDAFIACRQLGYNDYSRFDYTTSLAGSSFQPIWLDRLIGCSSSSSCLAYCESCPLREYHDCSHSEDVALECEYSPLRLLTFTTLSTCQYPLLPPLPPDTPSSSVTTDTSLAGTPSTTGTPSATGIPSTTGTPSTMGTPSTTGSPSSYSSGVGGIIGGVVAGFIILLCLIALSVGVPIYICVYRSNKERRPVTVATGTCAVSLAQISPYPDKQYPDQPYPDQPCPDQY